MTFVRIPNDYHDALREIEYLWGAESDTDEGRKLNEYLTALEQYEEIGSHKEQAVSIRRSVS